MMSYRNITKITPIIALAFWFVIGCCSTVRGLSDEANLFKSTTKPISGSSNVDSMNPKGVSMLANDRATETKKIDQITSSNPGKLALS